MCPINKLVDMFLNGKSEKINVLDAINSVNEVQEDTLVLAV
jgi:hypothetical protein